MKQNKMILTLLVILVCIACLFAGCAEKESASTTTPTTQQPTTTTAPANPTVPALINVNWEMEGMLVLADGTVKDNVPITISGTIQNGEDKDILLLDIITPEDFRYHYGMPEPDGYISTSRQNGSTYYYFGCYCFDRKHNDTRMSTFAIDAEKGFFLSFCDDGTGQYLVAATNPDVTAEEILEYFKKLDK